MDSERRYYQLHGHAIRVRGHEPSDHGRVAHARGRHEHDDRGRDDRGRHASEEQQVVPSLVFVAALAREASIAVVCLARGERVVMR
ncbi:MAG: hypothetical protein AAGG44_11090, partial [Planctomycetota bacterium]